MGNNRQRSPGRPRLKRPGAFSKWIEGTGLPLAALARELECSIQAVSNLRGGHCLPGRELANRIDALSKGAVPQTVWDRKPSKRTTRGAL